MADERHTPILPNGVPIQQAIASGDVERMRRVQRDAERHLAEVRAALNELRARIAGHAG
jgi:hypothetical protein